MKIKKFKKINGNRYQVTIDDQVYIFFDDIILKHNLLTNLDISENQLNKIISDNDFSKAYFTAIKYLDVRLRTEKEIKKHLQNKGFSSQVISNALNRLDNDGYFNHQLYLSSYINDQINLGISGPYKILNNLINLGFSEGEINKYLDFNDRNWNIKVKKIIDKKVNLNHNKSKYFLQQKIMNDLIILGYDKEMIGEVLSKTIINDQESFNQVAEKTFNKLQKKYNEAMIGYYFRQKMSNLGYEQDKINDYLLKIQ